MNHQDRINRLVEVMKAAELDFVAGFSGAAHHVDWGDAVALISGVRPLGPSGAIVSREGEVRLLVSPGWDLPRAQRQAQADIVLASDDFVEGLDRLFAGTRPSPSRCGVANLVRMTQIEADAVNEIIGGQAQDATAMVFEAGARKTEDELANARKATEIAEQAFEHLLSIATPGMPECEAAAALKNYTRQLGCDDNFMMFHAEGHPLAVQPAGERPFEEGDLILAEITPAYRSQFAQICRTACLGKPTDEQHEKYELVVRAMKNGIAQGKPGAPMNAICHGIDDVLRDAGYAEYCEPPYMNRRGHGLGVTSVEPGNVALNNETILEKDMFFVVHPNQYIPEVGYLLCGEPIIIRDPAPEVLTKSFATLTEILI